MMPYKEILELVAKGIEKELGFEDCCTKGGEAERCRCEVLENKELKQHLQRRPLEIMMLKGGAKLKDARILNENVTSFELNTGKTEPAAIPSVGHVYIN